LEHWLHHVAAPQLEPTTFYRWYRAAVEDYTAPFFARIRLADLTEEDIEAWHTWLAQRPSNRGGYLSPQTIRKAHHVLNAALKEAVARSKITRNPCDNVRPPRRKAAEVVPPSPEQVRAILAACRDWPNGARWV